MNDRFKFRAWSKRIEKFIYNIQDVGVDFSIECWEDCFGDFLNNENYIIEQCTSLKDKNGKLIYDGDIVRTSGNYQEGVYKIGWNEDDAEYDLYKGDCFIYQLVNRFNSVEVIGNIHENPELLENEE